MAGRFEPIGAVLAAQPHQSQARPVALLGMGSALEDAGDEPADALRYLTNQWPALQRFVDDWAARDR